MNMSNSVSPQITNVWPEDEKSRDFISLLIENGPLFIFSKDVKEQRRKSGNHRKNKTNFR